MAIDYRTPQGQVRLKIADVDPDGEILTDDMIEGFLYGANENVLRAAADALLALAASEAMKSKVIRTQDLQTDGVKLGAELRAQAAALRAQADAEDEASGAFFHVVPNCPTRPEGTEHRYGW